MGGGISAVDFDPTAAMSNPAGLAWLEDPVSFCVSSSALPFEQKLHFFGVAAWPAPKTAVGLTGLIYSAGDDIEFRSANTAEPDSVAGSLSQVYTVAAAWRFFPPLNVGISMKLLLDSIGDEGAAGFSSDLGLQYRPYARTMLAMTIQEVGGPSLCSIAWENGHSEPLEPSMRMGLAIDLNPILLVTEIRDIRSHYPRYCYGIEMEFDPALVFRAGLNQGDLAAGFGARVKLNKRIASRIDYSLARAPMGWSSYEHRVSLTMNYFRDSWKRGELAFPTERYIEKKVDRRAPPLFKWPLL